MSFLKCFYFPTWDVLTFINKLDILTVGQAKKCHELSLTIFGCLQPKPEKNKGRKKEKDEKKKRKKAQTNKTVGTVGRKGVFLLLLLSIIPF